MFCECGNQLSRNDRFCSKCGKKVESFCECGEKVEEKKLIKVNDYIYFGNYNNEPILWKCVDKDSKGVMLVSEYILCIKAFDAAESGKWGEGPSMSSQAYGSNKWENSNLREWLNSTDSKVKFTTQPPVAEAVYQRLNAYSDEPGFLHDFTAEEICRLLPVEHEGLGDIVYILSEKEINGLFGSCSNLRIRKSRQEEKSKPYWTRSPFYDATYVRCVQVDGSISRSGAACANDGFGGGVIPVLHLKSDNCTCGKGNIEDPYKVI